MPPFLSKDKVDSDRKKMEKKIDHSLDTGVYEPGQFLLKIVPCKLLSVQILCHVLLLLDLHNSFSETDNKTMQRVHANKRSHQQTQFILP